MLYPDRNILIIVITYWMAKFRISILLIWISFQKCIGQKTRIARAYGSKFFLELKARIDVKKSPSFS